MNQLPAAAALNNLDVNRALYEWLCTEALAGASTSPRQTINRISTAAEFAVQFHPGILADRRLEVRLADLGKKLFGDTRLPSTTLDVAERRVMHIATELYNTGGHTRVIRAWMNLDKESDSFLLVTRQKAELSPTMRNSLESCCRGVSFLPPSEPVSTAHELLRAVADIKPDFIVTHHHPGDVSACLAYANTTLPPVIFYNHADHTFSIGTGLSDLCVDFRDVGRKASERSRLATKHAVLPFPFEPSNGSNLEGLNKQHSRGSTITASNHGVVLVSMGASYKYEPFNGANFVREFSSFLAANPTVTMFIIGVTPEAAKQFNMGDCLPPNLKCLGEVEDASPWTTAADYFVEPYPIGSALAAFDTIRRGAVPIFSYCSANIHGIGLMSFFGDIPAEYRPHSRAEYFQKLQGEISSGEFSNWFDSRRIGFLSRSMLPIWQAQLNQTYALALGGRRPIQPGTEPTPPERHRSRHVADFCCGQGDPFNWITLKRMEELRRQRNEVSERYRQSLTWRLGRSITWLPSMIHTRLKSLLPKKH